MIDARFQVFNSLCLCLKSCETAHHGYIHSSTKLLDEICGSWLTLRFTQTLNFIKAILFCTSYNIFVNDKIS